MRSQEAADDFWQYFNVVHSDLRRCAGGYQCLRKLNTSLVTGGGGQLMLVVVAV